MRLQHLQQIRKFNYLDLCGLFFSFQYFEKAGSGSDLKLTIPVFLGNIGTKFRKHLFLKGQLHEIVDPRFFHQSTPTRALIHDLKPFRNTAYEKHNLC
jgi:hypothetical protein